MNKVISREYVEKYYVHKDLIRLAIEEGMLEAKGWGEEGGADILAKIILRLLEDNSGKLDTTTIPKV